MSSGLNGKPPMKRLLDGMDAGNNNYQVSPKKDMQRAEWAEMSDGPDPNYSVISWKVNRSDIGLHRIAIPRWIAVAYTSGIMMEIARRSAASMGHNVSLQFPSVQEAPNQHAAVPPVIDLEAVDRLCEEDRETLRLSTEALLAVLDRKRNAVNDA